MTRFALPDIFGAEHNPIIAEEVDTGPPPENQIAVVWYADPSSVIVDADGIASLVPNSR